MTQKGVREQSMLRSHLSLDTPELSWKQRGLVMRETAQEEMARPRVGQDSSYKDNGRSWRTEPQAGRHTDIHAGPQARSLADQLQVLS